MKNISINGQSNRVKAYNDGIILFECREYTVTFKLFGDCYTSSKRTNPYSFKQLSWRVARKQGFFAKLKLILTRKVRKMPKAISKNTAENQQQTLADTVEDRLKNLKS
jgi:hypothetical protein